MINETFLCVLQLNDCYVIKKMLKCKYNVVGDRKPVYTSFMNIVVNFQKINPIIFNQVIKIMQTPHRLIKCREWPWLCG